MKFITTLLVFLVSAVLYGAPKTNFVFLLADDLTRWDIGCYGSKDSRTPTIDRLADEGMKFTRCYQSAPMCSPTRHNLYTGIYPVRTGAYPNHTFAGPGIRSVVHHLEPLGYRVALSGKRHIGPVGVFPFDYLGKGNNPDFVKVDSFLQEVKAGGQPFCLFLCSNEPHTPWNKGDPSMFDSEKVQLPPYFVDNEETRENFCRYLAEIHYLDGQVSTALDLLDKHGLAENTVFMFASEQGNAFPFAKWTCYNAGLGSALIVRWPGVVESGSVSDALVEYADVVPTMIEIAGGDPVEGLDGKSLVSVLQGRKTSHKKYTFGEMTTRGIINGSDYYPIRSVSNGTYRYIVNLAPEIEFSNVARMPGWEKQAKTDPRARELIRKYKFRPDVELYNDLEDPNNLVNLAGEKKYRRIQRKLSGKLEKWMGDCGDRGLETELRAFEHMAGRRNGDSLILIKEFREPVTGGNLEVPQEGYYTFYIKGSGSIFVDGIFLVKGPDREGGRERYGIVALKKGLHEIRTEGGGPGTSLQWSGPVTKVQDLAIGQ
jgi:uncharacterized sulfatase